MGILDNDTVIVDAILTKIGRQKLAQGQPLGISKFAFGDTGVDYTLYNPNHPSGSDSYGSAITSLPMLEAVPDDNVFLRSKLWTGNRNVQNFSFITVENTSPTITKVAGQAESNAITIIPTLFPKSGQAIFDFKVMDMRGITISSTGAVETLGESGKNPSYDYPDPVIGNIRGVKQLVLTAASGYSTQKSFGIEVTAEGAAPIFITVTVEENITLG